MKIGRSAKWQHANPDVRIKALADPELESAIIISLATQDPDISVRQTAISRLTDLSLLNDLCQDDTVAIADAAVRALASQCNQLGELPLPALPPRVLLTVARSATDPDLRVAAVDALTDEASLLALLNTDNASRVWQACARQLTSIDTLETVQKQFLSRDKGVVQIVKDTLQRHNETRRAADNFAQECQTVATAIVSLTTGETGSDFQRRVNLYQTRWQHLLRDDLATTIEPALRERVDTALVDCQALINAQQTAARQRRDDGLAALTGLDTIHAELLLSGDKLSLLDETLSACRQAWTSSQCADADLQARLNERLAQLTTLSAAWQRAVHLLRASADSPADHLAQLASHINWPSDFPEPRLLSASLLALQARTNNIAQQQKQLAREFETLEQQLAELDNLVAAGTLKQASRLHNTISKRLDRIRALPGADAAQLAPQLERHQALAERIKELRDWQGFVTNPKRIALCEHMEALVSDTAPATEKAKAIKVLQAQWKDLGSSDSPEGQALWSRFKLAGDAAYAPCAAFFAEQHAARQENLAQRRLACDALEALERDTDWTTPNWKQINDAILQAQTQWRQHNDVPRNKFKKIQQRYTNISKTLDARRSEEQARNKASKSALIDQLKALIEADTPTGQLVEAAKKSQREWQSIGGAERRTDQQLWKAFRSQCDLIFARRDDAATEAKKAVNAQRHQAQQLLDQLKRAIADDSIDTPGLRQLQQQFRQINLDKADTRLRKDFDGLHKRANQTIKARARLAVRAGLDELRRKAELCRQLENGDLSRDAVMAAWDNEVDINKDWLTRIEKRRDQQTPGPDQLAKNQQQAAALCVQLEILAGINSPPEAQQQRMEQQVARLNKELSQGLKETRPPTEQLQDLQLDWYCLGPLPADCDGLRRRFGHAEAKVSDPT